MKPRSFPDRRPSANTLIGCCRAVLFGCALALASTAHAADVDGHLAWADEVRVSLPVSGVVEKVPVRAGEKVDKGALLVRLDVRPMQDRLTAAIAQRDGLVRAAAEAARDADRVQQLYDRTVASDSERQQALIKKEQAEAKLKDARAMVSLRRWQRGHAEAVAPYPARILRVAVAPGETVSARLQPPVLAWIARADKLDARVDVSAAQAATLHLGQSLSVTIDGTQVDGKVVSIEAVEQGAARYQVSVRIPSRSDWLAGMPVKVSMP